MTNRAIRVSEEEYEWLKKRRNGRNIPPEKQVQEDLKRKKAEEKQAETDRKYQESLKRVGAFEEQISELLGISAASETATPHKIPVKSSGRRGESTAVLVASDWHLEEEVDPETVDGLNEYNLEIAESRIEKFFQNGLSLIDMARTRSAIDNCILHLGGDLINGALRAEALEGNFLSPTEAMLKVIELCSGGIDFLLKEGKFEKLIIPCNYGNHGRTTEKPRVATGAKNSFEWMGYHFLRQKYANNERVHFQIANGYFCFQQVYDVTCRFSHGDGVRYGGGVGGVTIPLNKAIAQWNKSHRADIDILGHWHERQSGRNFVINGSVVGYNAYSVWIKASYEPPQQSFFLIHPERGKTVECPIFLS